MKTKRHRACWVWRWMLGTATRVVLLCMLGASSVHAQADALAAPRLVDRVDPYEESPPPEEGGDETLLPRVDLEVGATTTYPTDAGGYVGLEIPGRLLFRMSLGTMPDSYYGSAAGLAERWGADPDAMRVISVFARNSLTVHTSVGWRPFPRAGLELLLGHTLLRMRARLSDVVPELSSYDNGESLTARVNAVHAVLAYRFVLGSRATLRVRAGYAHALGANGSAVDENSAAAMAARRYGVELPDGDQYARYVRSPLLGIDLGALF